MVVYRIGLARAASVVDQAYGSTLAAGRWHSLRHGVGADTVPRRVIYAASSRALARLEKRVHSNGVAPVGQALFSLTLPARLTPARALSRGLDPHWRDDESLSQAFGNQWLDANRELALWVPSFVEPQEHNLIINALHPRLAEVVLVKERDPFEFDPRLA